MRSPDQIIKINGRKLPVFMSPFTRSDYDSIISLQHTYDEFGIMDNQKGKFKIYDFETKHIPDINYLWNVDVSFLKGIKLMGLGVLAFYAYRIATYRPKLPTFRNTSADTIAKDYALKDMFSFTNPNTVYTANGEGFYTSEEE